MKTYSSEKKKIGAFAGGEENLVLQLQTFPAMEFSEKGLTRYRKELIKVGKFIKETTGQAFEVTGELLDHWVNTFKRWVDNGNKVPIPLSHSTADESETNQGWATDIFREDDSLFGILELLNPDLALTTDVSIYVPSEVIDGRGRKYSLPISHISLCTDPVIPGLEKFMKLSLSKGVSDMEFLKRLVEKLGLSLEGEPTEEAIMLALDAKLKTDVAKVQASQSQKSQSNAVDPLVVNLMRENRVGKLNTLLGAGLITPAVKGIIEKRYVEKEALTLSLSSGADDGFDTLFEILTKNKTTQLGEKSGPQLLEMANVRAKATVSPIRADVQRRRVAAGLDKS